MVGDGRSGKRRLNGVRELNGRQPAADSQRQRALIGPRSPHRLCCQGATAAVRLSLAAVSMCNDAGCCTHYITHSSR